MCKNYRVQQQVIEQAKAETPVVFALYELFDGVRNLVGILKVFDGTNAECWNVHRYGDTEPYRTGLRWDKPSNRTILGWFGVDSRGYELTPC